jgi:hypothetical protein
VTPRNVIAGSVALGAAAVFGVSSQRSPGQTGSPEPHLAVAIASAAIEHARHPSITSRPYSAPRSAVKA